MELVPVEAFHLCSGPDQHRWLDPLDAARCCNGYERRFVRERDAAGDVVYSFEWAIATPTPAEPPEDEESAPFPYPAVPWHAGLTPFWPESPHNAFIESIKQYRAQGLSGNAPRAGLEVMRLVDRWGRRRFIRRSASFMELGTARCLVDVLPSGVTQRMLSALVSALMHDAPRIPSVWALLVGYASVLERHEQWELAADVLGTVIEQSRSREEQLQAPEFYNRIGDSLRKAGRPNAAVAAHRAGSALALDVGLPEQSLQNRIGEAAALLAAADIAASDRTYADVVRDADAAGFPESQARALHDRALAVYARRTPDGPEATLALVWCCQALRIYSEAKKRHRVLDDMATAFIDLAYPDVARDIYDYVFRAASDADVHLEVGLKGIRLAAQCAEHKDFEKYAAELAEVSDQMLPEQHADYSLSLGLGYWRSGRLSRARQAYARALSIAEDCQLYQQLHDAEQARAALDAGAPPPPPMRRNEEPPPPAIARVIASIRAFVAAQMRGEP